MSPLCLPGQGRNTRAGSHPLVSRMYKPDPKLPADQQDKRSVIPIEMQDVVRESAQLLRVAPVDVFEAESA